MDELFLYDRDKGLFKQVLAKSKVISGRYFIAPNAGHELNTANLEAYIKSATTGTADQQIKYPCCVCMTPKSWLDKETTGSFIEQFVFEMFFLCTSGYTGQSKVKQADSGTNRSTHHDWYDWKDMKEVAVEFLEMLEAVCKKHGLKKYFSINKEKILIKRLSKFNNDILSGVSITFIVDLDMGVCNHQDYELNAVDTIVIPELSIHPLHKH